MIFISHSSKNEKIAQDIRGELEEKHYKCFLSGDDIEADDDWYDEIWKALSSCAAFLGIVTKEYFRSAFCQQELGAALALRKPRLLVRHDNIKLPGFAARFQACKRSLLLTTLDTKPKWRAVRVAAWITAASSVNTFREANDAHDRFSSEWQKMTDEEKLQWLVAAGGNNQITGEGYISGPFFKREKRKLSPLLTDQWLYENDKEGNLHDWDTNPVGQITTHRKKVGRKKKRRRR